MPKTPALNPRAVQQRRARAEAATTAGEAFLITWNGLELPVFPGERSAADAAEFRKQTGLSLASMIAALGDESAMDSDIIAAVVWLAVRQNTDPAVKFLDIAEQIMDDNVTTVVDITPLGGTDLEDLAEEDPEDPKPSAGDSGPSSQP